VIMLSEKENICSSIIEEMYFDAAAATVVNVAGALCTSHTRLCESAWQEHTRIFEILNTPLHSNHFSLHHANTRIALEVVDNVLTLDDLVSRECVSSANPSAEFFIVLWLITSMIDAIQEVEANDVRLLVLAQMRCTAKVITSKVPYGCLQYCLVSRQLF